MKKYTHFINDSKFMVIIKSIQKFIFLDLGPIWVPNGAPWGPKWWGSGGEVAGKGAPGVYRKKTSFLIFGVRHFYICCCHYLSHFLFSKFHVKSISIELMKR